MKNTATESKFVSNESLFELKNAEELRISNELQSFLQESKFPWKAIGKNLTTFIEQIISSIPAKERVKGSISPKAFIENSENIIVCKGAVIEPGAFVTGPTFIGPNAIIRHGAYVRGSVYISEGAIIGHTTECKGSIFFPHAKAAHFNYVGDSILGYNCNLGAGTKLANLKLNHSNVILHLNDKKIDTGLKKFGAILGNRAQTGCNAVTNPGTILLPDAVLMPNQTALGIVSYAK